MPTIQNQMLWEVVGVPLVKGVDLNTRDRLIDPGSLAVADNVYYSKTGGPKKRRGHDAHKLYNAFISYKSNAPDTNLYGYGLVDLNNLPADSSRSTYPQSGTIKDVLVYEDREIAWDGWRLYEPLEPGVSGKCKVTDATLPTVTSFQTANIQSIQDYACACENDKIRVVAYITGAIPQAYAKVYDKTTNVLKFTAHLNNGSNDPKWLRTVSCGNYCHVLVTDTTDSLLYCYTIHQDGIGVDRTTTIQGSDPLLDSPLDIWKFDETRFLVATIDTRIYLTWINADGTVNTDTLSQAFDAPISGTLVDVAIAVHPVSRAISIFYTNSVPEQRFRLLNEVGQATAASTLVDSAADSYHIAVSPSYVNEHFHYFWDRAPFSLTQVSRATYKGTALQSTVTRKNLFLASRACRVGQLSFIWATTQHNAPVSTLTYQTTRLLLDLNLLPVANCEYGTAAVYTDTDGKWLPSINYTVSEDGTWNNTKFHGALLYNERVDLEIAGDGTTYSAKAIKFYNINFLPEKLSYDQAGKCVYIAGGQLWSYDGDSLHEANFGTGVEKIAVTKSNGAGSLTSLGVYRWRIDLCYRNAQNEECRAISFLTSSVTMGAADDTATLTFVEPPTRVTDAYYLIYRNENAGTVWYLVSSRTNPVQYGTNVFVDTMADTALLDKEQHAANAFGFLQPIAAPSCELITFGQNRLWVAGGELLPGEVWPSRLFSPGQTPAFHWALAIQIDRTTDPVTALAFQSNYGVVFKQDTTHIVSGNISPNIYQPVTPDVQLALADRGCINSKSIGKLYNSVCFQSSNGYKVISAAGQMEDIGFPVESANGDCIGAVLVRGDEHIRFYQSNNYTLVFDYRDKLWTTFSFNTKPSTAVVSNRTGLVVLARENELLYENADAYQDGDYDFHYTVKTAPLAKEIGGFQRVRRVYCIGEKEGIPPAVSIRIYQNCRDYWSEQVRWDYSDNLNTSLIGDGTKIGDGFIGDPASSAFRDTIWKWRMRLQNQKCENMAIEITDKGRMTANSQWIPVAFAIEVGTKSGLDRLSNRTFTKE